jgi:hypothetical protein
MKKHLLCLLLILCVTGCSKKPVVGGAMLPPNHSAFCRDNVPRPYVNGCPVWEGNTCWVNVDWMMSEHSANKDLPITIGKGGQIKFCGNDPGDHSKFFTIYGFEEQKDPALCNPAMPLPNGNNPFKGSLATTAADEQVTGLPRDDITERRCFKTWIMRGGHKMDPHIVIDPSASPLQ